MEAGTDVYGCNGQCDIATPTHVDEHEVARKALVDDREGARQADGARADDRHLGARRLRRVTRGTLNVGDRGRGLPEERSLRRHA